MSKQWLGIQKSIWDCSACKDDHRVELNIRQQTDPPSRQTKLLVVAVAPPHKPGIYQQSKANSVTNDPEDKIRSFLVKTLELSWDELLERGLTVLHAVKCAIKPNKGGFQGPPPKIVSICAEKYFSKEFLLLQPAAIITLGEAANNALLEIPALKTPTELDLKDRLKNIDMDRTFQVQYGEYKADLFVTYFPLGRNKDCFRAKEDIRNTAKLAKILEG